MSMSRRDLSLLLPALAAAQNAGAQSKEKPVLPAKVYEYADLPVKMNGENLSLVCELSGRVNT
jgi:hypothetical protein